MKIDPKQNAIICGDNLEWLKDLPNESVDLCYIDPPFFSNRNYEVIWGNGYELRSFGDRFAGGISHYIDWMNPRIQLIHAKLKKSGAIFMHCDGNASHRLRVLLDEVFGEKNFRNLITWKRCDNHNDARKQFSVVSDHILFYAKSDAFKFNRLHVGHAEKTLREWYLYLEAKDGSVRRMTKEERETQFVPPGMRRFNTDNLRSPNPRPNLMYDYKGYKPHANGWACSRERMAEYEKKGLLLFPKERDGRIMFKRYLDEQPGAVMGDIWTDIEFVRGNSKETMGYKTQKPVALIKRIIECACPEGGIVLDCFAGAATTAVAAATMDRTFIVGDVSPVAVKIMAERLSFDCPTTVFDIKNLPRTVEAFKKIDGHKFAEMVCDLMGWRVNEKKVADGGIDAWDGMNHPVQIKNQAKTVAGRPDMQRFYGALAKGKRKRGIFVAWGFSREAREFVADMKRDQQVEIILLPCNDIFQSLLIDEKKQLELTLLYKEQKDSKQDASAKFHKRVIERIKGAAEQKTARNVRRKDA
jgi:DNA modification methylase